jgi:hypothetical protein
VNKAEGLAAERVTAEFHELAMGEPVPISSAHGENVPDLIERALALCPAPAATTEEPTGAAQERVKVAIVGRPNVGKSTLVNTLLGEDRVLAAAEPGTTRDALYLDFDRGNAAYTLIDTQACAALAGPARSGILGHQGVQAIGARMVVLLLMRRRRLQQDAHIAGHTSSRPGERWSSPQQVGRGDGCQAQLERELDPGSAFWVSPRCSGSQGRTEGVFRAVQGDRPRLCGGDGEAADAAAHAGAAGGRGASTAAADRPGAAEAALRAPGRHEPAPHRDPWQRARQHRGRVPALPGTFLPGGVQTAGHAA